MHVYGYSKTYGRCAPCNKLAAELDRLNEMRKDVTAAMLAKALTPMSIYSNYYPTY